MGIYKYIRDQWNNNSPEYKALYRQRLIAWRSEESTTRIEHPTRLDRARSIGYKAKPGFILVRQRVGRGGHKTKKIRAGRKPRSYNQTLSLHKNYQWIAEERAHNHYPNLVLLNSYPVAKDGKYAWYEIVLVDPQNPVIAADPDLQWVSHPAERSRVYHGKTSAGKRVRGLRWKGMGVEKARPSRRAHLRRQ